MFWANVSAADAALTEAASVDSTAASSFFDFDPKIESRNPAWRLAALSNVIEKRIVDFILVVSLRSIASRFGWKMGVFKR